MIADVRESIWHAVPHPKIGMIQLAKNKWIYVVFMATAGETWSAVAIYVALKDGRGPHKCNFKITVVLKYHFIGQFNEKRC